MKQLDGQLDLFHTERSKAKIDKPVRLIELFAGYGSQMMAFKRIGANVEHWCMSEWEVSANSSYKAVHTSDDTDYIQDLSDEEVLQELLSLQISNDGKTPMTEALIKRKGIAWQRRILNEFRQNKNLGSICKIHRSDLNICDTDDYTYFVSYSFPCQSLSLAGRQEGMKKGSGTRSGMLWEVERLLTELVHDGRPLPQILFMENVPQVHSQKNMPDFQNWLDFLESLGYSNYYKDLNAKDYGIPQSRKRCYMFSFLDNVSYEFPKRHPLTKCLKDILEDEVDERYYLKGSRADDLIFSLIERGFSFDEPTGVDGSHNEPNVKEIANCITSRQDRGISNHKSEGTVVIEPVLHVIGQMEGTFECNNRVYDINGLAPTINTMGGGDRQPKIIVAVRGRNPDNPNERVVGAHTEQRLEPNTANISNTLTTVQKDNLVLEASIIDDTQGYDGGRRYPNYAPTLRSGRSGLKVLEPNSSPIKVKQATKKGYIECCVGGVADLSYPISTTRRGRVQENGTISPTIACSGGDAIYKLVTAYRIRKLTPRECGRLMDVSDSDIDKMIVVNSMSGCYKQFGNSIVVNVMCEMFQELYTE